MNVFYMALYRAQYFSRLISNRFNQIIQYKTATKIYLQIL